MSSDRSDRSDGVRSSTRANGLREAFRNSAAAPSAAEPSRAGTRQSSMVSIDGSHTIGDDTAGNPHTPPPGGTRDGGSSGPTSCGSFRPVPVPKPPDDADTESKMAWVQYQLDCIGCEAEVLNGLQLLGSSRFNRLQGGMRLAP
jgi:hypothetical protein